MSKAARRLGRGLNSLVSDLTHSESVPETLTPKPVKKASSSVKEDPATAVEASTSIGVMAPTSELSPNRLQPRGKIKAEDVVSLTQSIAARGILQPIVVRKHGAGYEIIAGERRWTAAKAAGLREVPVIVRDASDAEMLELALIENIQREDLNAIDRAKAYREFCDRFDLRPEEVAERLGEDRTTVVNYLRLLDLSARIRGLVSDGRLGMGHARCLLGVADEARREELVDAAVSNQLSVRALEEIVRREKTRTASEEGVAVEREHVRSAHVHNLEQQFEQALKTRVVIKEGKRKGTGRMIIEYYSLDDFDRIASALGVEFES